MVDLIDASKREVLHDDADLSPHDPPEGLGQSLALPHSATWHPPAILVGWNLALEQEELSLIADDPVHTEERDVRGDVAVGTQGEPVHVFPSITSAAVFAPWPVWTLR